MTRTFAALADPTRRAILARLATGEASVSDLAKPLKITMPAVTKHLKVLERAGLIRRGKQAQWRPCYLVAEPLKEAANWVEQYRQFWEARFDRLDNYLREMQAEAEEIRKQKPESEPPAKPLKERRKRNEKQK